MFPEGMVFLVAARKLVPQGSSDGLPRQDCILSSRQTSDPKRSPGIPCLCRPLGRDATGRETKQEKETTA